MIRPFCDGIICRPERSANRGFIIAPSILEKLRRSIPATSNLGDGRFIVTLGQPATRRQRKNCFQISLEVLFSHCAPYHCSESIGKELVLMQNPVEFFASGIKFFVHTPPVIDTKTVLI